jgi:hypothetical protein
MPLAVPMEALYASPATTINPQYPCDLPMDTIADENLFSIFIFSIVPDNYNSDLTIFFLDDGWEFHDSWHN